MAASLKQRANQILQSNSIPVLNPIRAKSEGLPFKSGTVDMTNFLKRWNVATPQIAPEQR